MAKRLQTNDLNRRVTIQRKGRKVDDAGFPIRDPKEWEDVDTLWAAREPIRGREFFSAAADRAEITVRYKIRYREGITSEMRLVDTRDNRIYEIKVPLDDVFDDRTETHLLVAELSNG